MVKPGKMTHANRRSSLGIAVVASVAFVSPTSARSVLPLVVRRLSILGNGHCRGAVADAWPYLSFTRSRAHPSAAVASEIGLFANWIRHNGRGRSARVASADARRAGGGFVAVDGRCFRSTESEARPSACFFPRRCDWDRTALSVVSGASDSDDDRLKWERMYYGTDRVGGFSPASDEGGPRISEGRGDAPLSAFDVGSGGGGSGGGGFGSNIVASSDVRVVTFDLDNTLWKTGATISIANDALAAHLVDEFRIPPDSRSRSEVLMGRLFQENPARYGGIDAGVDVGVEGSVNEKNDGGEEDDGVHIRAKSAKGSGIGKPVYLTRLRKDAIREILLAECGIGGNVNSDGDGDRDKERLNSRVDAAFDVWMDARARAISENFVPGAVTTLRKIRSAISPVIVGAITDGNSDPRRVPELMDMFDFVIRAEDVGVSKPDAKIYRAAVAAVAAHSRERGGSLEDAFFGSGGGDASEGRENDRAVDTTSDASTGGPQCRVDSGWKEVDESVVDSLAALVGSWWIHVGDDFVKDIIAAKGMNMRSVWVRELILPTKSGEAGTGAMPSNGPMVAASNGETKGVTTDDDGQKQMVADFVEKISKKGGKDGFVEMTIGEDEFLADSIQEEFSDATLDRFGDLADLLIGWHREGLKEERGGIFFGEDVATALEKIDEDGSTGIRPNGGAPKTEIDQEAGDAVTGLLSSTSSRREKAVKTTKFCVFCGKKLPEVAVFCSDCGEKQ